MISDIPYQMHSFQSLSETLYYVDRGAWITETQKNELRAPAYCYNVMINVCVNTYLYLVMRLCNTGNYSHAYTDNRTQ